MNMQAKIVNILTLVENILHKKTTSGHLKWLKSNFTDQMNLFDCLLRWQIQQDNHHWELDKR